MAIGYAVAALICFVLIVTIPFGIASLRIGIFALWPFGKTLDDRAHEIPLLLATASVLRDPEITSSVEGS